MIRYGAGFWSPKQVAHRRDEVDKLLLLQRSWYGAGGSLIIPWAPTWAMPEQHLHAIETLWRNWGLLSNHYRFIVATHAYTGLRNVNKDEIQD
jgi:hypothetical protein